MARYSDARRRRGRRNRFGDGEDVNPMNYVSNLSDVMLILAVGIMLALILHWNVELETADPGDTASESKVEFTEDDLESREELPDNMEKAGEVYYDADTGTYYIIENR